MRKQITPIDLPPHMAFMGMWVATWCEAVQAATDEMLHWWCMPFPAPHPHHQPSGYQLELPEPLEDESHIDLFA